MVHAAFNPVRAFSFTLRFELISTDTRIPRWMRLAMPEDVAQIAAMVDLEYRTPEQRMAALRYELRELRRTQWERKPCKPARRPSALRPSKHASGYRTDSLQHKLARRFLSAERRVEIARMGAAARWARRKEEV